MLPVTCRLLPPPFVFLQKLGFIFILFPFLFFLRWSGSCYVAQADLKLMILLAQPHSWHYWLLCDPWDLSCQSSRVSWKPSIVRPEPRCTQHIWTTPWAHIRVLHTCTPIHWGSHHIQLNRHTVPLQSPWRWTSLPFYISVSTFACYPYFSICLFSKPEKTGFGNSKGLGLWGQA